MTITPPPNRPRAFRIPAAEPAGVTEGAVPPPMPPAQVRIVEEPFEIVEAADGTPVPVASKSRAPWLSMLLVALGGLVSLGVGLSVERLIADLFGAAPWLGAVALVLLGVAALGLLGLVLRELSGIWRERQIERLRARAVEALATRDHSAAQAVVRDLSALYAGRAALAAGRTRLDTLGDAILDVDDRLGLAEHELLAPLDRQARQAIATAAKQVSGVTALSPRAIVDVAFVIFAAVRLLRQIATIYGGRPGFLGFLRLARSALAHLTVTGGMAVGESMIQQALGLGLAAKVSAKLGEGVLNGLMTARFGLAALAVCRPLPFVRAEAPRLSDVAGSLFRSAGDADDAGVRGPS
ncbi:YcjF family protein [Methylobacterium sp. J-090]|uniref:YcjF family protein n=1 Tax=Methylobacterium sp. J-090 TaxID=2836666 RepID=UPI001FBB0095|nr:TIGR01620 family protein [Methylobacterium sp. J-090]MCJ2082175.1 TIGR01620 family protein [Methylobacterium sp. J-090]